jgi:hypothetical protein
MNIDEKYMFTFVSESKLGKTLSRIFVCRHTHIVFKNLVDSLSYVSLI